jgi:hypothetical protein
LVLTGTATETVISVVSLVINEGVTVIWASRVEMD